jgi:hypothetical protein
MIKPPSDETPSKIRNNKRWYPYFKVRWNIHLLTVLQLCNAHKLDCLSIVIMLGLHWSNWWYPFTARVPKYQSARYKGRKHYISQNVLAAVDFDLKFTYVCLLVGKDQPMPHAF